MALADTTARPPRISLVMPAFNEEENLAEAVREASVPLAEIDDAWEIVLVNDGSTDGTRAVADRLASELAGNVRVIHHATNRGLGGAIRSGFEAARGEVIAYCDSDLPFEMSALLRAYTLLEDEGADVVAGYRHDRGGEGARRALYSTVYNTIVRAVFGLRVRDVNFSLKLLRREVFDLEGLHSAGSFIDAELLARAHLNGFRIVQMGVDYTARTRGISTLSRPSVIAGILRELLLYRVGRLGPKSPTPRSGSVYSAPVVAPALEPVAEPAA